MATIKIGAKLAKMAEKGDVATIMGRATPMFWLLGQVGVANMIWKTPMF